MTTGTELEHLRARGHLNVLCVLFLFWSALFILLDPPHWEHPSANVDSLTVNPGWLTFLVSIALWLRWATGRYLALAYTWFYLLAALTLFSQLVPIPHFEISGPRILPGAPLTALHILIAPFILAQVWQLYVLKRRDIRELFSKKARASRDLPHTPLIDPKPSNARVQ